MKFILEVDLAAGVLPGNEAEELGRILRYWAGNVKHYELSGESTGSATVGEQAGVGEQIVDSSYAVVGAWTLSG